MWATDSKVSFGDLSGPLRPELNKAHAEAVSDVTRESSRERGLHPIHDSIRRLRIWKAHTLCQNCTGRPAFAIPPKKVDLADTQSETLEQGGCDRSRNFTLF